MTSNFSFGAKNAHFRFSNSSFSSKVGGSKMEGANLRIASVSLSSALAACENSCTKASSYPMEARLSEVEWCAEFTEWPEFTKSEIIELEPIELKEAESKITEFKMGKIELECAET